MRHARASLDARRDPLHLFTLVLAAALLLIGLAPPAEAGRNVAEWDVELEEARDHLRAGEYKLAEKITRSLLKDYEYWIIDGSAVNRLIGQTFALRAVAAMGQGEARLAAWDFSVGQAFYPEIQPDHLKAMGPAGDELIQYLTQNEEVEEILRQAEAFDESTCDDLTPPKIRNRGSVEIPFGLQEMLTVEKEVIIAGVAVDRDGKMRTLTFPKAPRFPTMAIPVAESLREAYFEPPRCDGDPMPFRYNLSTTMEVNRR